MRESKFLTLLPSITAGVIAVLIGFVSSVAILFQAATAAGASPAQTSSWVFAVCLGAGLVSIIFSFYYKMPILAAWSTPGAALLSVSLLNVPMEQTIGAFVFSGLLVIVAGMTGWFEKAIKRIPVSIASAMLAGILLKFGMDVFVSLKAEPFMVGAMLVVYFAAKKMIPRYAVMLVLLVGTTIAALGGKIHLEAVGFTLAEPIFVMPQFSFSVLLSIGIPLFVVTMASQNLPGIVVLRSAGYQPPISPMITATGVATLLLAPFGGFSVNMAAITAAICAGPEANRNPSLRYVASISAGVVYLFVALLSSAIIALFGAFPKELILALGGIALFVTIANGMYQAVKEDASREAAVITFLVTASGVSLFGIGSAFWGLLLGVIALFALRPRSGA